MQNTTHYNLKKPDYTDFADIQDINDNMDTIDEKLSAPTGDGRDQTVSFTDADLDTGITSFPTFLTKIVSGMKLAKFLRDFKAGMAYVLHVGSLVNNATCTESGKALDARMGKTLQDQITSLNDSLSRKISYTLLSGRETKTFPYTAYEGIVIIFGVNSMSKYFMYVAYTGYNNVIRLEESSGINVTASISNNTLTIKNNEDGVGYRCAVFKV